MHLGKILIGQANLLEPQEYTRVRLNQPQPFHSHQSRSGRLCPDRVEGVMLIPRHTRFESILLMDELLVIANEIKHERYSAYQISQLDTWSALIYAEVYEIIMRSDLCVSAAKQLRHRLH